MMRRKCRMVSILLAGIKPSCPCQRTRLLPQLLTRTGILYRPCRVAGFTSERWPASRRNPWPASIGIRSPCRGRLVLVQRSDRRSDHQAQIRQTPNVRAREARFAAGQAHRRTMTTSAIKSASEPKIDPLNGSGSGPRALRGGEAGTLVMRTVARIQRKALVKSKTIKEIVRSLGVSRSGIRSFPRPFSSDLQAVPRAGRFGAKGTTFELAILTAGSTNFRQCTK